MRKQAAETSTEVGEGMLTDGISSTPMDAETSQDFGRGRRDLSSSCSAEHRIEEGIAIHNSISKSEVYLSGMSPLQDPSPAPWKPYFDRLREEDFQGRWEASKYLASFGEEILPDLLSLIEDPEIDSEVLWFVTRILGQMKFPQVAALLVRLLESDSEEVASAASAALARFGTAAIEPLQNLMGVPERKLMAVKALAYIRSDEMIPVLMEALGDRDPVVRSAAIETLCCLPGNPEILKVLVESLGDPSARVRLVAVKSLAVCMRIAPDREWTDILSPLLADVDLSVAIAATAALGRLSTQAAVRELDRLLQDRLTPPPLQRQAVRALTWIDRFDAIQTLQKVLNGASLFDRATLLECIQGLGRYEPASLMSTANRALQEWFASLDLSRQSEGILQELAHSLGRLGQPDSIPSLISLLQVNDSGVRCHAIAALKRFNRSTVTHLLQQSIAVMAPSNPQREGIALALSEI